MRRSRPSRGISLIEVMVAMTILVIITLASMPSFVTWAANSRVRSAAEGVQNGFRLAQAEGVRANATVTLRFSAQNSPGTTSAMDPNGFNWVLMDGGGAALHYKGVEGSYGVVSSVMDYPGGGRATAFSGSVDFNGLGQNNLANAVQFCLTDPRADRPLSVVATPGGRVRMCDPQRPNGDPQSCGSALCQP